MSAADGRGGPGVHRPSRAQPAAQAPADPLVLLIDRRRLILLLRSSGSSPAPTTSPPAARSAPRSPLAVPIGLAGLGGLWSERAGVVNIGLEGMMILGTWGAGWAGYQWGPWAGVLVGVALGGRRRPAARGRHRDLRRRPHRLRCRDQHPWPRRHAVPVRRRRSRARRGGGESQSPPTPDISEVSIPGLADPLAHAAEQGLVPRLRPGRHRCAGCSPVSRCSRSSRCCW